MSAVSATPRPWPPTEPAGVCDQEAQPSVGDVACQLLLSLLTTLTHEAHSPTCTEVTGSAQ